LHLRRLPLKRAATQANREKISQKSQKSEKKFDFGAAVVHNIAYRRRRVRDFSLPAFDVGVPASAFRSIPSFYRVANRRRFPLIILINNAARAVSRRRPARRFRSLPVGTRRLSVFPLL
jgi:hypothetical protein